jgi:50S ribosomal protein L16 3-hydroxylase
MTCSVGFRSSSVAELGGELLARAAEVGDLEHGTGRTRLGRRYRDPAQPATAAPGRVPQALQRFAQEAVQAVLAQPGRLEAVLGEWLTEPKPQVWFQSGGTLELGQGLSLDARTRMMYDDRHVFLNGESFLASGRDAQVMRQLADRRALGPAQVATLGPQARGLLEDAVQAGWMHALPQPPAAH